MEYEKPADKKKKAAKSAAVVKRDKPAGVRGELKDITWVIIEDDELTEEVPSSGVHEQGWHTGMKDEYKAAPSGKLPVTDKIKLDISKV